MTADFSPIVQFYCVGRAMVKLQNCSILQQLDQVPGGHLITLEWYAFHDKYCWKKTRFVLTFWPRSLSFSKLLYEMVQDFLT